MIVLCAVLWHVGLVGAWAQRVGQRVVYMDCEDSRRHSWGSMILKTCQRFRVEEEKSQRKSIIAHGSFEVTFAGLDSRQNKITYAYRSRALGLVVWSSLCWR